MDTTLLSGFLSSVTNFASGAGEAKRREQMEKIEAAIAKGNRDVVLQSISNDFGVKFSRIEKQTDDAPEVTLKGTQDRARESFKSFDQFLKTPEGQLWLAAQVADDIE